MSTTETKYCQHCGQIIAADAVVCVHCGRQVGILQLPDQTATPKKPVNKRWWFWPAVILGFFFLIGVFSEPVEEDKESNDQTEQSSMETELSGDDKDHIDQLEKNNENTQTETKTPKYLTDGAWALTDQAYAFAVEVEGYEGDIFEAGDYVFSLKSGRFKAGKYMPALFGVYVTDTYYDNALQTKIDFPEASFYIGGTDTNSYKVTLETGKYVYVIPVDLVLEPTGVLQFSLAE